MQVTSPQRPGRVAKADTVTVVIMHVVANSKSIPTLTIMVSSKIKVANFYFI